MQQCLVHSKLKQVQCNSTLLASKAINRLHDSKFDPLERRTGFALRFDADGHAPDGEVAEQKDKYKYDESLKKLTIEVFFETERPEIT